MHLGAPPGPETQSSVRPATFDASPFGGLNGATPMQPLIQFALLLYACSIGIKLLVRGQGDLRTSGALLAFVLVPILAIRAFWPGVFEGRAISLHETTFGLFPLLRNGTLVLLGVLLLSAFASWVRIRSRGEDFLGIHKALFKVGVLLISLPLVIKWLNPDADLTKFLTAAGVGTVVLGFSLQNTLGHLFAGIGLEMESVFRQGEYIQIGVGGPRGVVVEKTWRATRILTSDGQTVFVPNTEIGNSILLNYDRPTRVVALRASVSAGYPHPPVQVKEAILEALKREPDVLAEPQPQVWLQSYGDSGINYTVHFWINRMRGNEPILDRVHTAIWYAFEHAGIEIPFPIRTLRTVDMEADAKRETERRTGIDDAAAALAGTAPFGTLLPAAELRCLAHDARVVRCAPGARIIARGEIGDCMFVVKAGTCVVPIPGGTVKEFAPGSFFGEIAILKDVPRIADVDAGPEGAEVVRLGRVAVRAAVERSAALRQALFKTADDRLEEARKYSQEEAPDPRRRSSARHLLRSAGRLLRPW